MGRGSRTRRSSGRCSAALPEPVNLIFWLGYRSGMRPGEAAGVTLGEFACVHEGAIRVGHSDGGPLKEDRRAVGKVKWVTGERGCRGGNRALVGAASGREGYGSRPRLSLLRRERSAAPTSWAGFKKEHLQSLWEAARAAVGVELTILPGHAAQLRVQAPQRRRAAGAGQRGDRTRAGHHHPSVLRPLRQTLLFGRDSDVAAECPPVHDGGRGSCGGTYPEGVS
jgi:hypothetical protein